MLMLHLQAEVLTGIDLCYVLYCLVSQCRLVLMWLPPFLVDGMTPFTFKWLKWQLAPSDVQISFQIKTYVLHISIRTCYFWSTLVLPVTPLCPAFVRDRTDTLYPCQTTTGTHKKGSKYKNSSGCSLELVWWQIPSNSSCWWHTSCNVDLCMTNEALTIADWSH
jgi:hypothetical protein